MIQELISLSTAFQLHFKTEPWSTEERGERYFTLTNTAANTAPILSKENSNKKRQKSY